MKLSPLELASISGGKFNDRNFGDDMPDG